MKSKNTSLNKARAAKQDEFYTQLVDIEKELQHYQKHFKGKTILCNCDDPRVSNFFHYFSYNFEKLKLKKLIAICYKNKQMNLCSQNDSKQAIYLEYNGDKNKNKIPDLDEIVTHSLKKDGDFRNDECIEILKQSDIVVTNPPFSLFREYVAQLMKYRKKFIILGNLNASTNKEIFPLIKNNQIWFGHNVGDMSFRVPDYFEPRKTRYWQDGNGKKWRSLGTICWFTNLDIKKRHENIILTKSYNPKECDIYDECNNDHTYHIINVGKVTDIPNHYNGMMGVPITFLSKYNPDQFEIVGLDIHVNPKAKTRFSLNGKQTYARIIIKQKRGNKNENQT